MKVSELGEHGVIELLAKTIQSGRDARSPAWKNLIIGIGDDAAAWRSGGSVLLATTDALRENVHFTRETLDWHDLGWKALAVNLSDIAAMGGLPQYALVTLAVPEDTEVENILALYRGMLELAGQFGVAIIGGDTDRAPFVDISVAVFGNVDGERSLLRRTAAKVGDRVAVTGSLGGAAAGLEMLTKHLDFDADSSRALRRAFCRPNPRVVEGQVLLKAGVKTAIDVSDGLVADMGHICRASNIGAIIETSHLPVEPTVRTNFGDRALELALSGGEDYELLFTASDEIVKQVESAVSCPITIIGEIIEDRKNRVTVINGQGRIVRLAKSGWDHFQKE